MPNVEMHVPYETQAYAVMVLEGAHGDGSRSAMRKAGWETLPRGGAPIDVEGWYPPSGVPAAAIVDFRDDPRPEIVVSLNDGHMHAFGASANELWSVDYTHGKPIMFASEPTIADLNRDGEAEVLFATYGDPDVLDSGYLMILSAVGTPPPRRPAAQPGIQRQRQRRPCRARGRATSTATASSRSSSRPLTTPWTSSPCPDRPAIAPRGPPPAEVPCAWVSRTATISDKGRDSA